MKKNRKCIQSVFFILNGYFEIYVFLHLRESPMCHMNTFATKDTFYLNRTTKKDRIRTYLYSSKKFFFFVVVFFCCFFFVFASLQKAITL